MLAYVDEKDGGGRGEGSRSGRGGGASFFPYERALAD